jgi:L-lactate dehydrogenase complex protein LldE
VGTRFKVLFRRSGLRVALFITCYNDTLFPQTGKAVVKVLERLGHTVEFPAGQTCCGQMHWNTGYQAEALPPVGRFVDRFRHAEAGPAPIELCCDDADHYPKMAEEISDGSHGRGGGAAARV